MKGWARAALGPIGSLIFMASAACGGAPGGAEAPPAGGQPVSVADLPAATPTAMPAKLCPERPAVDLLLVECGTIPILLTAPHGGTEEIPGVPERTTGARTQGIGTSELAQALAERLQGLMGGRPYLVAAKVHRKFLDVARQKAEAFEHPDAEPYYAAYHEALRSLVRDLGERYPQGSLLVDIRAQSKDRNGIFRGTRNGLTVTRLRDSRGDEAVAGGSSVLGGLLAFGFSVIPSTATVGNPREDPDWNGGYIVATYGSQHAEGVDAIQMGIGTALLQPGARARLAQSLADVMAVFSEQHLGLLLVQRPSGPPTPTPIPPTATPAPPTPTPRQFRAGVGEAPYQSEGKTVRARLWRPQEPAAFPGVLILHTASGLTSHEDGVARRLAEVGYAALAVAFSERTTGEVLRDVDAVASLKRVVLDGARHLRGQAQVDPDRLGVVGFSLGGFFATYLATWPEDERVGAAVVYYGMYPPGYASDMAPWQAPVLVLQGEADAAFLLGARLWQARTVGKAYELVVYPKARHQFDFESIPDNYDPQAAETALARTVAFLRQHLGQ